MTQNTKIYKKTIEFIRTIFKTPEAFIPLHAPIFIGNEKKYLNECIDSTFVSSVGAFVNEFEEKIKNLTGSKYAIATSNGTSALHMALVLADVQMDDLVITQPLTFIATCNAISYLKAQPLFIDNEKESLGMSPEKLADFFKSETSINKYGICIHNKTNKKIKACVPMHTYGQPSKIDELVAICKANNVLLIEDSAESIGSKYKNQATGTFGELGIFSFNGNKTITCGGGGVIITNNEKLGKLGKHLTTQAKMPHRWEFRHDFIGYNYRMPNVNAALAVAQLECLDDFIANKRELAAQYQRFFEDLEIDFFTEIENAFSNYWLNIILLKNRKERDEFLTFTNDNGVMTRPAWVLMNELKMFENCICENIENAQWLADRLVNIPSSVRL